MRQVNSLILVVVASIFVVTSLGCNRAKRPRDFPDLEPCTITIVNGANPVQGASILLSSSDGTKKGAWIADGITDDNGVAQIKTSQGNYSKKGVPTGKYKLTLSKEPKVEGELPPQELEKLSLEEYRAYTRKIADQKAKMPKEIPDKAKSQKETPLDLDVPSSGCNLTIDLSEYM